ncbi:MAG TPA: DUF4129 domain-containing protein [Pirellulales bacterium]|jgi:hypothetical protein|nr:DUF4129 domain-containing protein [Pirellulales bacterium]
MKPQTILFALSLLCGAAPCAAWAEPDDGVEEARQALGSSWRFPWYDGSQDDLRRVNVRTPWNWTWKPKSGSPFNLSWLQIVILVVAALLLAGLAYLLIKAYLDREDLAGDEQAGLRKFDAADDAARIEALPFRLRRGALDLLEEARRHYAAGNYSEAVIYLFSHELVELDRGRMIRLAKGKTNRQYLRELAVRPTLKQLLEQTMVAFEDVFFGNYALQRQRFEACWRRLDEFDDLLAEGRPA